MQKSFFKMLRGYQEFRKKYALGDESIMHSLADQGQKPEVMIVSCCDSRVDPALILQCEPGDLFVVRNIANIVPPYEKDGAHHGTSAALEFGIRFLNVKHLILLGHSECGGIHWLLDENNKHENDFLEKWISIVKTDMNNTQEKRDFNEYVKSALNISYQNCLTFPWIKEKIEDKYLMLHMWFFDIKSGKIFAYSETEEKYTQLDYFHITNILADAKNST